MLDITVADLKKILPKGSHPSAAILNALSTSEKLFEEFQVTTVGRLSMFFGEIAVESDYFATTKEYWGPTKQQLRYDNTSLAVQLGNVRPGDGKKFAGNGLMQITGRANHRAFTQWMRGRDPSCPDFEETPDLLEQFPWALLAAFWYWDTRKLNVFADRGDIVGATKKINGGTTHLVERTQIWKNAQAVLGAQPTPGIKPDAAVIPKVSEEVKKLQGDLVALGYGQVVPTGVYDKITEGAVRDIQTRAGITVDGIAGPATESAIQRALEKRTSVGAPTVSGLPDLITKENVSWGAGIAASIGASFSSGPVAYALAFGVAVAVIGAVVFLYKKQKKESLI